jgi:hypothetical protein
MRPERRPPLFARLDDDPAADSQVAGRKAATLASMIPDRLPFAKRRIDGE